MADNQNYEKDINVPRKEIIIDGIDVSGCIELNKRDKVSCYHLLYNKCKEAPNCYFKQLARKTQECESLKQEIEILQNNFDTATRDCNDKIEILKQECEELLKENQQLRNSLSDSLMFKFTGQENETNRYRKALEEIEKVINNILNSCLGRNTVSCRPAHNVCGDLINILDIISRAKAGE